MIPLFYETPSIGLIEGVYIVYIDIASYDRMTKRSG